MIEEPLECSSWNTPRSGLILFKLLQGDKVLFY
jgi:hypothetical protein